VRMARQPPCFLVFADQAKQHLAAIEAKYHSLIRTKINARDGPLASNNSTTTSGSASLMRIRIRASVSPRQSLSSLILASIRREGESPPLPSFEPLFVFFIVVVAFFMLIVARPSLAGRSEEHTSELQSPDHLVCR